jgi:cytochrome o ubiquinol oxidase subunit I
MHWFMGFVSTFTFGGMAGVLMSDPAADFQVHNSLFLVAHFHTMIIGGALFGIFAGITYWFPKVTGWKLNERIGKYAFWCWLIGFFTSFVPLYILGFMGATRRLDHYDLSTGWQPLFITAAVGVFIIGLGAILQVLQIIISFKQRKQNIDKTGDPWNGRTLEWSTSSPPPFYNFAVIPRVHSRDAFWEMKKETRNKEQETNIKYEDIELPKNTAMGIYVSGFAFLFGFAMVWHSTLFAIIGLVGAITCVILRTFDEHTEYTLSAAEVERIENDWRV